MVVEVEVVAVAEDLIVGNYNNTGYGHYARDCNANETSNNGNASANNQQTQSPNQQSNQPIKCWTCGGLNHKSNGCYGPRN